VHTCTVITACWTEWLGPCCRGSCSCVECSTAASQLLANVWSAYSGESFLLPTVTNTTSTTGSSDTAATATSTAAALAVSSSNGSAAVESLVTKAETPATSMNTSVDCKDVVKQGKRQHAVQLTNTNA
jgi:hypothetical protein